MGEIILHIKSLQKSFGKLKATDNVNLDLRKGEIHALIGPNGTGKSTLIGQIAGNIQPDSGSVHFDGRDISVLDVEDRQRVCHSRSFQVSSLMLEFSTLRIVKLV